MNLDQIRFWPYLELSRSCRVLKPDQAAAHTTEDTPKKMAAPPAGFLAERLAKASALPAEQRSADVRAFIETYQLQTELAEELGLPEVISIDVVVGLRSRWSAAPALKLVRSHLVSLCGGEPLQHTPHLHNLAAMMLTMRASTGFFQGDLGPALTELLEGDPGLEKFAISAAGLPRKKPDHGESLFFMETQAGVQAAADTGLCCLPGRRAPKDVQQRGGAHAAAGRAGPAPERARRAAAAAGLL